MDFIFEKKCQYAFDILQEKISEKLKNSFY